MNKILYLNNNGKVLENKGPTLRAGNRGHLYGDGLFETIRIFHGKPINVYAHITRLKDGMGALKMRIPSYFSSDFFTDAINELIQKSGITDGGKCRISVDRASGSTFRPDSNEVDYFIEVYPLEDSEFKLNTKGWEVDLYNGLKKEKNALSAFKTKNCLLFIMAAIEAQERGLDDVLISNTKGEIVETSSANIFVVRNRILYTPGLEDGCLGGTMRMSIINTAIEHNIKVYESSLTPQHLLVADEIILTNAIRGVIWVGGYRTRRYKNDLAKELVRLLNERYN